MAQNIKNEAPGIEGDGAGLLGDRDRTGDWVVVRCSGL